MGAWRFFWLHGSDRIHWIRYNTFYPPASLTATTSSLKKLFFLRKHCWQQDIHDRPSSAHKHPYLYMIGLTRPTPPSNALQRLPLPVTNAHLRQSPHSRLPRFLGLWQESQCDKVRQVYFHLIYSDADADAAIVGPFPVGRECRDGVCVV